jgi:hypothetical protein
MKKVTLLCGLLLAMSASIASAGAGVGLRWTDCIVDGGAINRAITCASDLGSSSMVGSFELAAGGLANVSGNEVVIDIGSASPTLPEWWQFVNIGACRANSLSMNFVGGANQALCADWAQSGSSGGIGAYIVGARGANTARIVAALAVPPTKLKNLLGLTEYYSFSLKIDNVGTVGPPTCGGCNVPVCIVFNSVNVTTPVLANNVLLTGPLNGTDGNYCTWFGGGGVVTPGGSGCPLATATKSKTWSQVKALYH